MPVHCRTVGQSSCGEPGPLEAHARQDLVNEAADPVTVGEGQGDVADARIDQDFDLAGDGGGCRARDTEDLARVELVLVPRLDFLAKQQLFER